MARPPVNDDNTTTCVNLGPLLPKVREQAKRNRRTLTAELMILVEKGFKYEELERTGKA